MLTAKDDFLFRINNFERIVSPADTNNSLLISKALTETIHNEKVRMLRNGMAIIGYSILVDFIKKRVGEILKEIGKSKVTFDSLPIKLKNATTFGALKGIQSKAEILKRNLEDHLTFIQNETLFVSSTKNSVFELSEYSLGWGKSNLSSLDITNFLSVFNVNNGWTAIQQISSAININLTNPNESFKNSASRRHKAAHNTNADSLLTDLQNYVSEAKVIAFAFDSLISQSLIHIKNLNTDFLNETIKTEFNQLSFRFILEVGTKWKEFRNNSTRAFRVKDTLIEIQGNAETRAISNKEILVVKSSNNQIIDWKINT